MGLSARDAQCPVVVFEPLVQVALMQCVGMAHDEVRATSVWADSVLLALAGSVPGRVASGDQGLQGWMGIS